MAKRKLVDVNDSNARQIEAIRRQYSRKDRPKPSATWIVNRAIDLALPQILKELRSQ